MVLPQYTFAALAIGAIAAIAVTLYATLGARQQQRIGYGNRTQGASGSGDRSRSSKYRQRKCEVCQKTGVLVTIPCGHIYHKSCLLNLHGDDIPPECPECCVVCWEKISKEGRVEIERERNVECSICLEDIECKSLVLECGHEYHNLCANKMIQYPDRKCPNCRIALTPADLRRIIASV